jgi:sulfate/thiosulfate transport system ATP-binding protein
MAIVAQHISKRFKDFTALENVSLEIASGELVALLGPSGSGKTTLLRIIAGLEAADSGSVLLDGEQAQHKGVRERNVGFVFQHYALFKHMTVFDNVAFGLKVRPKATRPSDGDIRRKVMDLLQMVHLDNFADRYPAQLSGGQRQRVALARALAVEPKVLLLDEPFGALDAKVRKELRRWMRRLHDEIHITSIFVTHDQEEAMEVSDRVVVMSNGKIEQMGTPAEVWQSPANAFVYDFLGNYNAFDGWKDAGGVIHFAEPDVMLERMSVATTADPQAGWLGTLAHKLLPKLAHAPATPPLLTPAARHALARPLGAKSVKIFARPHEMWITKTPDGDAYIKAKVIHVNPAGSLIKLEWNALRGRFCRWKYQKVCWISSPSIKERRSMSARSRRRCLSDRRG